jgi:cell division protein FtsA
MGEILEPRVEEMLTLINYELVNSGVKNLVNAGVVLTGGTSMLVHILDLAEQIFDLPVRIGYPRNIGGVTDIVNTPQCATGVGLVIYGMKSESERGFRERGAKGFGGLAKKLKGLFGKLM